MGLEGIVSKVADRPYVSGPTMDWRKVSARVGKKRTGSGGRCSRGRGSVHVLRICTAVEHEMTTPGIYANRFYVNVMGDPENNVKRPEKVRGLHRGKEADRCALV